jgi:hypothetical protein
MFGDELEGVAHFAGKFVGLEVFTGVSIHCRLR